MITNAITMENLSNFSAVIDLSRFDELYREELEYILSAFNDNFYQLSAAHQVSYLQAVYTTAQLFGIVYKENLSVDAVVIMLDIIAKKWDDYLVTGLQDQPSLRTVSQVSIVPASGYKKVVKSFVDSLNEMLKDNFGCASYLNQQSDRVTAPYFKISIEEQSNDQIKFILKSLERIGTGSLGIPCYKVKQSSYALAFIQAYVQNMLENPHAQRLN